VRTAVHLVLAVAALLLCRQGVSWAIRPGQALLADELENLTRFVGHPIGASLNFLPQWIYNDRPAGFLFEQILFVHYGFDYAAQIGWLLAFHFANAALAFVLFRRLGVSTGLSLAGVAVFGSLSTTAQTATYLGASFDVLCTFFILASMLSLVRKGWQGVAASTLLFFLALRSKEFAISAPVLLTLFLVCEAKALSWRQVLVSLKTRLWPHYLLAAVFAVRYASFIPTMRAAGGLGAAYRIGLSPSTVFNSLSYYTALVFGAENSAAPGWRYLPVLGLGAILGYSIVRRRPALLFGLSCYALTLLPVCLLPNIRAPYYVYGPQIFLLLVMCLAVEEIAGAVFKREPRRWAFTASVALASMLWAALFVRGPYFQYRAAFVTTARTTAARTARDATPALSHIGSGGHVYLNHGRETPWLFTAGPCAFLRLLNHGPVTCIWQKPEAELLALYDTDPAEKYFVDYFADGSLKVRGGVEQR